MDKSLKELLADGAIQASLSGTEQNILRMAGNGKSPASIGQIYGCSEAEVDRIIESIRSRVASATGATITSAAAPRPPTGDSSQARRPPSGSPRRSGPPAKDRIVAYLREHGETRQGDLCAGAGIKPGSIGDALRVLEQSGVISVRHDGRAKFLSLVDAASRSAPSPEPAKQEVQDDWIDQFVNRKVLDDEIERLRELIAQAQPELDKLENLQSLLSGVGVL